MPTIERAARALQQRVSFEQSLRRTISLLNAPLAATAGLDAVFSFLQLRDREKRALNVLLNPKCGEDRRQLAARRLVSVSWNRSLLSPKPSNPGSFVVALRSAKESGLEARSYIRLILERALLRAADEAACSQHVRIGAKWITGEDGRKAPVVPRRLPRHQLIAWLRARAYRALRDLAGSSPKPASRAIGVRDSALWRMAEAETG